MVLGDEAFERRLDHFLRRGGDDVERAVEHRRQEPDVVLEAHAPAGLEQVFAADAAELGIVQEQVSELAALLDEADSGQSGDALVEAADAHHLAQHGAGIVEAERLVEVADEEIVLQFRLQIDDSPFSGNALRSEGRGPECGG